MMTDQRGIDLAVPAIPGNYTDNLADMRMGSGRRP